MRPQDLSCLRCSGRSAIVASARIGDFAHQLSIARRESVGFDTQVVLQPTTTMSVGLEAALVDVPLVTADAGCNPRSTWQHSSKRRT